MRLEAIDFDPPRLEAPGMNKAILKERIFKALNEKGAIQSFLCRRFLFDLLQPLGFHLMGDHFYEVIPNTREIEKTYVDAPRPLGGIDWDFPAYERLLLNLLARYGNEFTQHVCDFGYEPNSHYFQGYDALTLYLLIRHRKPRRMIELGQGHSTRVALAALEQNARECEPAEFISVDPYARLDASPPGCKTRITFRRERIQDIPPGELLAGCDFLFFDTSHAYRYGNDLEFIFLHLLDRLEPGTLVHAHDIFSPYDYPRHWFVKWKRFWNEQYILENFLRYNTEFRPVLPVYSTFRTSQTLKDQLGTLPLPAGFIPSGASFYFQRNPR